MSVPKGYSRNASCTLKLYFMHTGVQRDFHLTWCPCPLKVTRRTPLVKQELFSIQESLSLHPLSVGSCCSICIDFGTMPTMCYYLFFILLD